MQDAMRLTVAMCTYNPDTDIVLRALDAIVAQLGDVPSSEVIVIDNNSFPPLAERDYMRGYPVRLIREPKEGLTAAREAAIESAQGDVIVFVDDDNILGERYLATVMEEFAADSLLGLLGGCIVPEYEVPPPGWLDDFERWLAVRRYSPELRVETTELPVSEPPYTTYFPVGAGFATRRALARAYVEDCASSARIEGRRGGALSSGEDLDFGLFLLSRGCKLVVTGALRLTHVIPGGRVRSDYLMRLAASNVRSSLELERKWSARFGRAVEPMFSMPLASLLARAAVTWLLGLCFRRYKIKRCVYTGLIRARLSPRGNLVERWARLTTKPFDLPKVFRGD
jgi:glycosyltransferase involved in cell wall biosynthesis